VLGVSAAPSYALNIQVVNDSGRPPPDVYLTLHGEPLHGTEFAGSTDGQLKNNEPKPLSEIRNGTFSIGEINAGRLYVSYARGFPGLEAEQAPMRYDKIELTNPGVADLTAVDFFAIPFDLQAFDASGAAVGSALTYRCSTATILEKLRALAPGAEVRSPSGQFLRFNSPQHAPGSYPSMKPYVVSMAGQQIEVNDVFSKAKQAPRELHYKGTFAPDGSITLTGTITAQAYEAEPAKELPAKELHIEGTTLPEGIYTGNGPYAVGGNAANVGENNEYSVIYRDIVAGFALGYWGGIYGNNSLNWLKMPDLAAARSGPASYATYDQYAAIIGEYSSAYGYSFHDLGPTPVQLSLNESVATLRLTIDADQGPATPGCLGESTRTAPPPPPPSPAHYHHHAKASGRVKVVIDSRTIMLDKRGRALVTLSCGGDPCKGELTLNTVRGPVAMRGSGRRGNRARGRKASKGRRRRAAGGAALALGRAEFSIGEGEIERVWVPINRSGQRKIRAARRHKLSVLAKASVGPTSKPTIAGQRRVVLKSYAPPRRRRHR
jgi:hypothetical protein